MLRVWKSITCLWNIGSLSTRDLLGRRNERIYSWQDRILFFSKTWAVFHSHQSHESLPFINLSFFYCTKTYIYFNTVVLLLFPLTFSHVLYYNIFKLILRRWWRKRKLKLMVELRNKLGKCLCTIIEFDFEINLTFFR